MIEIRLATDLLAKLRASESHYHENGYLFVLESIEYLQRRMTLRRHVSGPELARACRDHALEQYGLVAKQVLSHWGIRQTEDLGKIVFALVDVGLLSTQPDDRVQDFESVFDFDEAFSTGYVWMGVAGGGHRPRVVDSIGDG